MDDNHFVAHPEGGVTTEAALAQEAKADTGAGEAKDQETLDAEAQAKKEADEKAAVLADLQAKAESTATKASEARTKADSLKAALTDNSTDEQKNRSRIRRAGSR